MDIIQTHLLSQQEEMIKIQILLHALVDELVEANLITTESLDERLKQKVDLVNKIIDKQKEEFNTTNMGIGNIFGGTVGEA